MKEEPFQTHGFAGGAQATRKMQHDGVKNAKIHDSSINSMRGTMYSMRGTMYDPIELVDSDRSVDEETLKVKEGPVEAEIQATDDTKSRAEKASLTHEHENRGEISA